MRRQSSVTSGAIARKVRGNLGRVVEGQHSRAACVPPGPPRLASRAGGGYLDPCVLPAQSSPKDEAAMKHWYIVSARSAPG